MNEDTPIICFNHLPKELRTLIWTYSLPGPRIVYIERHLYNTEQDRLPAVDRDFSYGPFPTYFTSPSPSGAILSLVQTCHESRAVVEKHYSLIFTKTWFSFEKDFLYLDWGRKGSGTPYRARDFVVTEPDGSITDKYLRAKITDAELTKKVKNLAVKQRRVSPQFMDDIPPVFPNLDVLVMVDQLHHRDESDEELVWVFEELGNYFPERDEDESSRLRKNHDGFVFMGLLLWNDTSEYILYPRIDCLRFMYAWEKTITSQRYHTPLILNRGIVTSTLKQKLVKICSGIENFRELTGLNVQFIGMEDPARVGLKTYQRFYNEEWDHFPRDFSYNGRLDLHQQIAYLDLVLSRILRGSELDEKGFRHHHYHSIVARRDRLAYEAWQNQLLIMEAEGMD